MSDEIPQVMIDHFNEVRRRFDHFSFFSNESASTKEHFGMRPTMHSFHLTFQDSHLSTVQLHEVLDYIAASTFEAADAVGHPMNTHASEEAVEAGMWLAQQAACISAAALFCKTWEPNK